MIDDAAPAMDTLRLTQEATMFAESDFGQHYMSRLRQLRQSALDQQMDRSLDSTSRIWLAAQASTLDAEIQYFAIAGMLKDNNKVMQSLRDKRANSQTEAQEHTEV